MKQGSGNDCVAIGEFATQNQQLSYGMAAKRIWTAPIRAEALAVITLLAPNDVFTEARAWVLSVRPGAWDVADLDDDAETDPSAGWRRAEEKAREIGRVMINEPDALAAFLPEVLAASGGGDRSASFGAGLGEGASDLGAAWSQLCAAFAALDPSARNSTVLGNFLRSAGARDQSFVSACLNDAVDDPVLAPHFAFLQVVAGLNGPGIDRTVEALNAAGTVENFWHLSHIDPEKLPAQDMARLLDVVIELPRGPALAVDMLWRYFYRLQKEPTPVYDPVLIDRGRRILTLIDLDDFNDFRDSSVKTLASAVLAGDEGRATARVVGQRLYAGLNADKAWRREAHGLVRALFKTQPEIALDTLVDGPDGPVERLFRRRVGHGSPLDSIDLDRLTAWAEHAPERRYAQLGAMTSLFRKDQMDTVLGLNPTFLALLNAAPDKLGFLGDAHSRVQPNGWSGSLAEILASRKALLDDLPDLPEVAAWREREYPRIDRWIAIEREREAEQEESFE
jgi:hypothetical protein